MLTSSFTRLAPSSQHALHGALVRLPQSMRTQARDLASHFLQLDPAMIRSLPGLTAVSRLDLETLSPSYCYLLHGLLATSAFHLTLTGKDVSGLHARQAYVHLHMALTSYITAIQHINAQSCHFIFGFSIILAGLQVATCSTVSSEYMLGHFVQIFELMQGSLAVANAAKAWISVCDNGQRLLSLEAILRVAQLEVGGEVNSILVTLLIKIESAADRNVFVACLSAIHELQVTFSCLARSEPDNIKAVVAWFAFVDTEYLELVRKHHPAALTILAYYGVALSKLHRIWWLGDVGVRLIHVIDSELQRQGAEIWRSDLEWPLSQSLSNPPAAGTRSCANIERQSVSQGAFSRAFECTYAGSFIENTD